jgi:uncharacterized cupin superfamily protein
MEFVVNRSACSYGEHASKVELTDDPMEFPKEELEGTPVVSSEMLSVGISEEGRVVARGLLQCTPGKYKDYIDDDEFFTIVSGRATMEIENGPKLELLEGSVGEVSKGSHVIYTVHETILKSFQLSMSESDEDSDSKDCIKAEHECASANYAVLGSSVALQPEVMEERMSWINSDPAPEITSTILSSMDEGHLLRGLWRCTAGSCTFVEQDELFTVLAGRATVTIKTPGGKKSKTTTLSPALSPAAVQTDTSSVQSESLVGDEWVRVLELSRGMVGEFKVGDVATFEVQGEEAFLKSFQITTTAFVSLASAASSSSCSVATSTGSTTASATGSTTTAEIATTETTDGSSTTA